MEFRNMKYMGSKKNMLLNGLGDTFFEEIQNRTRVVDLMSGSASVAWFIAQNFDVEVIAIDLQKYSQILANSVLQRTKKLKTEDFWENWFLTYKEKLTNHPLYKDSSLLDKKNLKISEWSKKAKFLCSSKQGGIVWNAYGGYYYSPFQALQFDMLLESIEFDDPIISVAQASVIIAASQCSASPGHTAQPFKPNETAGIYLKEAWQRDPVYYTKRAFNHIADKYSNLTGNAYVMDALVFAKTLNEKDLVFIDPPYSGVHYSRFYHVLESIARGYVGEISGVGRYPSQIERPVSPLSRKSESELYFRKLIKQLSERVSNVIITYPDRVCSNGLSGDKVLEICSDYFHIKRRVIDSKFSTLGGNNKTRLARQKTGEMILVLTNSLSRKYASTK
ncbi:MAG: hypothetical protein GF317_10065 [Candidatus Lokiarchaeota archaeon]|nr:hypothetical protein [Candidatus Lokiarchaeota archaeon]